MRNETLKKTVVRTIAIMMMVAAIAGFAAQSTFACDEWEPAETEDSVVMTCYWENVEETFTFTEGEYGTICYEYSVIEHWADGDELVDYDFGTAIFYEESGEIALISDIESRNEYGAGAIAFAHYLKPDYEFENAVIDITNGQNYFF